MKMTGEQRVAAPGKRVWEALNDPDVLRQSIPGCQSLEQEAEDRFSATVEVKVGPIGARFTGTVSLTDINPPTSYTLILEGHGGMAGTVKGSARVRLSEEANETLVSWEVDVDVGGRMAQLGGPVIDATAKQLAGKFFARFGEIVGEGEKPAEPTREPPSATAPAAGAGVKGAATAGPGRGFPIAWILAIVVGTLAGFILGRGPDATDSAWAGIAIGLLLILVAGAAFEYGRRSAAPTLVLDDAVLRRLTGGER